VCSQAGTTPFARARTEEVIIGQPLICTQITDKCRKVLEPWVQGHVLPPHGDLDYSATGSNCMGTIATRLSDSGVSVYRLDEHAAALKRSLPERLCV
jgi:hypothetical protein